jgi:hypothetical protein
MSLSATQVHRSLDICVLHSIQLLGTQARRLLNICALHDIPPLETRVRRLLNICAPHGSSVNATRKQIFWPKSHESTVKP